MKFYTLIFALMLGISFVFAQETPKETPKKEVPQLAKDMQLLGSSNMRLSASLYQALSKDQQGNLFFSPISIQTALAMVYMGASGRTREEMAKVFGVSIGKDRIEQAYSAVLAKLNANDSENKLRLANSLWVEKTYPILKPYSDRVEKYFGGQMKNMDFVQASEPSRQEINTWVSDRTEKRIENLIPSGIIDPSTVLVLVNAIYMKAGWADKFSVNATKDASFFGVTTVTVPLMKHEGDFRYFEDKKIQVLELPYKGETLAMVVILPKAKDGLPEVEKALTGSARVLSNLAHKLSSKNTQRVEVSLPKFKMTGEFELSQKLEGLGMKEAFSAKANFSEIERSKKLSISNVIHKTFISLDEEGTEAAGATAVIMRETAVMNPRVFRADHPFMFFIYHKETGTILFMGRLVNPN